MKMLKTTASDCLDHLSRNFDEEFGTSATTSTDMSNIHAKRVYSFSDEDSSFGSSLNQVKILFYSYLIQNIE